MYDTFVHPRSGLFFNKYTPRHMVEGAIPTWTAL
jgi:hypothetical protein